jgi:hypothetical protein
LYENTLKPTGKRWVKNLWVAFMVLLYEAQFYSQPKSYMSLSFCLVQGTSDLSLFDGWIVAYCLLVLFPMAGDGYPEGSRIPFPRPT